MFRYIRVAVAVALSFCAVAAPAQALAPLLHSPIPATLPAPTLPGAAPAVVSVNAPLVPSSPLATLDEMPAPATSLAQLVLRHSSVETNTPELECLAAAVYFESKGEPLAGQLAVARVITNRSKLSRFAATYCGVVRQAGQFSFVRGHGFPPIARSSANWRTAVAIATIADRDLWSAQGGDALYFHARRVAPNWRMVRVAAVGNHVFYR